MIKFAIIGSNWITEKFINGTIHPPRNTTQQMALVAVYSRDLHKANGLARKFSVTSVYTDLNQLAVDKLIDAVYIASPNSLHYAQSKLMLEHNKHVICEKPLSSNFQQTKRLYQIARDNNVILFEAYKTAHLPNFKVIRNYLAQLGPLRNVHLQYCQYSSRYAAYLAGQNPNTFNPAFANGSIMDIGYYCIAMAIDLFGAPDEMEAQATLLESGVDGCGRVRLNYKDFSIMVDHSKITASDQFSEIQGEKGVLLIDHVGECQRIFYKNINTGALTELSLTQAENSMSYEVIAFVEQIKRGEINKQYEKRSLQTASVLQQVRDQTKVVFPDD